MKKKFLYESVKIAISLFLLYAIFTKIDITSVIAIGRTADMRLITVSLALLFIAWTVAAAKWYLLLPKIVSLGFWKVFTYTLIGATYTVLLPGGQIFGEVGKYAHISDERGIGKKVFLISIILDKILGLCALIGIGFLALLSQKSVPGVFLRIYAMLSLIAFIGIAVLLLISRMRNKIQLEIARTFRIILSLALSFLYQLCIGIIVWTLSRTLGMNLSIPSLLWISTAVGILTALPITYGGLGIREVSFGSLLSLYAIPSVQSVALSLIIFMLLVFGSLPGLFLIFRDFVKARSSHVLTDRPTALIKKHDALK